MIKYIYIIILALVTISSCIVVSPNPFFKDESAFNPKLLGNWVPADDEDVTTYFVSKKDSVSYKILMKNNEDKKEYRYIAHYLKIGKNEYIDLFPDLPDSTQEDYSAHLNWTICAHLDSHFLCHTFLRGFFKRELLQ